MPPAASAVNTGRATRGKQREYYYINVNYGRGDGMRVGFARCSPITRHALFLLPMRCGHLPRAAIRGLFVAHKSIITMACGRLARTYVPLLSSPL